MMECMDYLNSSIRPELREYIEKNILPCYEAFDAAHRVDHAEMVIAQSLQMAMRRDVSIEMVYAIAAYHDTGLSEGRERHHLVSGEIVRTDANLCRWFTAEQIEVMAQAVEDHRASADHAPRSVYGMIVAEADRFIDPYMIIKRTIQYGKDHYPEYAREEHYVRMVSHLKEKYGYGGYLRLWFADSPNMERLEQLRQIIDDEARLRQIFESIYE